MILSETSRILTEQVREGNADRVLNPEDALKCCGVAQRLAVSEMTPEELLQYTLYITYDIAQRVAREVAELKARQEIAVGMNGNRAQRRRK